MYFAVAPEMEGLETRLDTRLLSAPCRAGKVVFEATLSFRPETDGPTDGRSAKAVGQKN